MCKKEHLPVCVYRRQNPASAMCHLVGRHAAFAGSAGTARPYIPGQPHVQHCHTLERPNAQRNEAAENYVVIVVTKCECTT